MKKYINPTMKFVALASEAMMAAASVKVDDTKTVDPENADAKVFAPTSVWDE